MADLRDPLFKGCTRPVLYMGVPLEPFILTIGFFVIISVWSNFFFVFMSIPVLLVMRAMVEKDDQQFRLLGIKLRYRFLNTTSALWGTPTHSPIDFKKR